MGNDERRKCIVNVKKDGWLCYVATHNILEYVRVFVFLKRQTDGRQKLIDNFAQLTHKTRIELLSSMLNCIRKSLKNRKSEREIEGWGDREGGWRGREEYETKKRRVSCKQVDKKWNENPTAELYYNLTIGFMREQNTILNWKYIFRENKSVKILK